VRPTRASWTLWEVKSTPCGLDMRGLWYHECVARLSQLGFAWRVEQKIGEWNWSWWNSSILWWNSTKGYAEVKCMSGEQQSHCAKTWVSWRIWTNMDDFTPTHQDWMSKCDQKGTLVLQFWTTNTSWTSRTFNIGWWVESCSINTEGKCFFLKTRGTKSFRGPSVFGNSLLWDGDLGTATWRRNIRRLAVTGLMAKQSEQMWTDWHLEIEK
jgi:hypothetical protein